MSNEKIIVYELKIFKGDEYHLNNLAKRALSNGFGTDISKARVVFDARGTIDAVKCDPITHGKAGIEHREGVGVLKEA